MCPRSIAGVPSSHALLGFLITAPQSVCVLDVIGALACGFQTKKKKRGSRKPVHPQLGKETQSEKGGWQPRATAAGGGHGCGGRSSTLLDAARNNA
jgi:hypothetical protein